MKFIKTYSVYAFLCFNIFACNSKVELKTIERSNENIELENGILKYNSEIFSGTVVSYHSNFILKSRVKYSEGRKEGFEHYWFENGELAMERHYSNGIKTGVHRGWWTKNHLKFEYHFNTSGSYHGEVKEWYNSGQKFREFHYDNGQEIGSQRLWKLNGSIKANYTVYNGDRFGLIGLKNCATVSENPQKL